MSDPLLDLDLGAVELYLSVVELGSISKAAARHGLSQPTASQRVRKLELQLGVTLLDRSASGSALTPDGRNVAEWCRELIGTAAGVVERTHALREQQRLQASVAVTAAAAAHVLPGICAELSGSAPLSLDVTTLGTLPACAAVRDGAADLALVDGPEPPLGLSSEIVTTRPMQLVVAPTHRWSTRSEPVPAAELAATPLVLREGPSGTRDVIEAALAASGNRRTSIAAAEAPDNATVRALCALGVGPAIVCQDEAVDDLGAGRLVAVRTAVAFTQPVRLVWAGEEPRSPGARRFASACR